MLGAVVVLALVAGISASADVLQASPDVSQHDSRIVSGWEAREGQFPFMLWLRTVRWTGDVTACGGSIIHRSWGLTSARCTAQKTEVIIHAGSVNRNTPRVVLQARQTFRPPGYIDDMQPITQPHDISLMRFSQDLNFDNNIQPIRIQRSADRDRDYTQVLMTTSGWGTTWTCLEADSVGAPPGPALRQILIGIQRSADRDRDYTQVLMTTSGWGTTWTCLEADCPMPVILNWVHLKGISNLLCLLLYNSNWHIRPSTVCAISYNVTSQGICAGDSGVPLTTVEADGVASQVGIGSFASGWGCHVGMPGGFTRTGYYHDWITQVTGINFDRRTAVADDDLSDVDPGFSPISLPLPDEEVVM
ncbi:hypothetical protein PYW07_008491 [Mythimna separata]|uniref:Peptidase S1 domain-containing protein n=1 Tax=Mythimna separata TaxID=271217 RepID=A0AAD7YCS4_MYTSE|nr:hypothetical protein PYW07_008491 [Mythimna separata]